MLVIADRDRAQAIAGVMGGADSEVSAATDDGRVRERVLQAGLGPAHEQAARPQDRGVVALRARRRHRRAGRRAPARDRADAADRRRPAGRLDRRPLPAAAPARSVCTCAASGSRVCSARRCPTPTSCGSCAASDSTVTPAADGWDAVAPTFRVDLLREADLIEEVGRHYGFDKLEPTFPVVTQPAPAARSAHPARSARAPRADGGRLLRSGDVRLHRSEGRRSLLGTAETAKRAEPRCLCELGGLRG